MRSHTTVVAIALLLLCGTPAGAAADVQSHDDALAALFYPNDLHIGGAGVSQLTEVPHWRTMRADLDANGSANYLVVAYSNGFSGRLRVIREDASGPVVVADPREPIMFQSSPSIAVSNLAGDPRPEIVVTFANGRKGRPFAWVFQWDGQALTNLNPVLDADSDEPAERREITDPTFVDIDGDGRIEILEPSEHFGVNVEFEREEQSVPLVPDRSYNVLTLSGYGFRETDVAVAYFGYFERSVGKPIGNTQTFKASTGNYVLRILNSEQDEYRVESAEILVNGRIIASPGDFRGKSLVIEKQVSLNETNTITVELRGRPGSRVNVVIQRAAN
jgi:hypothetical protein